MRSRRVIAWIVGAVLLAAPVSARAENPQRIVSINLCTDQLALLLAPRERIAAVSILAGDGTLSSYADRAAGITKVPASLEDVVALKPDLVLAGSFGHGRLTARLEGLGIRVERFADAANFDDIRTNLEKAGVLFGNAEGAREAVASLDAALAALPARTDARRALLLSPGMLVHSDMMLGGAVMRRAGLANMAGTLGNPAYLDMERLVAASPGLLILAAGADAPPSRAARRFDHPVLAARMETLRVDPAALLCGTPETAKAAARLAEVGR